MSHLDQNLKKEYCKKSELIDFNGVFQNMLALVMVLQGKPLQPNAFIKIH